MPIQPFIFVGVGGTGGKTLGVIRKTLGDALSRVGWEGDWPDGWQFIHVDVPADADADTGGTPYDLPRTSYVPLTTATSTYVGFSDAIDQGLAYSEPNATVRYQAWGSWRPDPASRVKVEIRNGAGQYRAIGRVCVLKSLTAVDKRLSRAFDEATSASAEPQLKEIQEKLGRGRPGSGEVRPVIFVIGSVSGGSGSGMLLDVVDVLRAQGHREVNAVVFTPEVFEKPNGATEPGVAPNTILALAEMSNSMWTHEQSDSSLSRDRLFGQAGVTHPVGHSGPSTVFLVGRRNRAVTFDSAGDVYKIVGRSLGELALDEKLTTAVVNYDIANGNAVAGGSRDALELSVPDGTRDVAPFRGLGFARLSVGRDFFDRYATDRLARRVGLRLLDGHLERRTSNDVRSDEELRKHVVDEAWAAFLRDSGLDEVREQNTISDALNTWQEIEVQRAQSDFVDRVRSAIAASTNRKGRVVNSDARTAAASLVKYAADTTSDFGISMQQATKRLAVELQDRVQADLQTLILKSIAKHGLPVTLDLVDRLVERASAGAQSLDEERRYVEGKMTQMVQALPNVPAGASAEFPAASVDEIKVIVDEASKIMRRFAQSFSQAVSKTFLEDVRQHLLQPWRQAIRDADGLLRLELRPEVGLGPLEIWPRDEGIPDYLRPSKVEFLLDDVEGFPEQFVGVIERSVAGLKGFRAVETAMEQIIEGQELGVHAQSRPVVVIDRHWVPTADTIRGAAQDRSTALIRLQLELPDLVTRTHEWLDDQEKYVGQFLKQSMGDYLTDPLADAAERKQRQSRVISYYEVMLKSSLPLVALDSTLTNLIHGHDVPPYNVHVSDLNIPDQLADVRKGVQDASVAVLKTNQPVTFTNTPRDDAMMMTLLSEPYHLVEVASIMSPIARQWARGGRGRDMWTDRRARPLPEWVPLGPDARRALVTGWFAARLLGQATVGGDDRTALAVNVNGTKLEAPREGVRAPTSSDHVGLLLEGLLAAFLECYNSKSLHGIRLYQHLIALGAQVDNEINPITSWVKTGDGAKGSERVRQAIDNGTARTVAATDQINAWTATYAKTPSKLGDVGAAQNHPSYEVYEDVMEALKRLQSAVDRPADDPEDY